MGNGKERGTDDIRQRAVVGAEYFTSMLHRVTRRKRREDVALSPKKRSSTGLPRDWMKLRGIRRWYVTSSCRLFTLVSYEGITGLAQQ